MSISLLFMAADPLFLLSQEWLRDIWIGHLSVKQDRRSIDFTHIGHFMRMKCCGFCSQRICLASMIRSEQQEAMTSYILRFNQGQVWPAIQSQGTVSIFNTQQTYSSAITQTLWPRMQTLYYKYEWNDALDSQSNQCAQTESSEKDDA